MLRIKQARRMVKVMRRSRSSRLTLTTLRYCRRRIKITRGSRARKVKLKGALVVPIQISPFLMTGINEAARLVPMETPKKARVTETMCTTSRKTEVASSSQGSIRTAPRMTSTARKSKQSKKKRTQQTSTSTLPLSTAPKRFPTKR